MPAAAPPAAVVASASLTDAEIEALLKEAVLEVTELEAALLKASTKVLYFRKRLRQATMSQLSARYGPVPASQEDAEADGVAPAGGAGGGAPAEGAKGGKSAAAAAGGAKAAAAAGGAKRVKLGNIMPDGQCRACHSEAKGVGCAFAHTRGGDGSRCRLHICNKNTNVHIYLL